MEVSNNDGNIQNNVSAPTGEEMMMQILHQVQAMMLYTIMLG